MVTTLRYLRLGPCYRDTEWEQAKYHPKKSLTYFLGDDNPLPGLLKQLTAPAIAILQQHPLIIELMEFLSSVIKPTQP